MSESDDCLFCKIIAGQIPSSKVYEDETTYAFNDINPKAKVHVLVVPKKHYANVAELAADDPTELAHIVSIAQNIADKEFHGAYRLVFNTGLDAGQTVFHVHAHVMTGEKLDEQMEEVVRKLEEGSDPDKLEEQLGDAFPEGAEGEAGAGSGFGGMGGFRGAPTRDPQLYDY